MTKPIDGLRTKWGAVKAAIQATWFWRVYGVCAMKRTWTKFLIATALVSWYGVALHGGCLLTPILQLEQMHREEGVLLSIGYSTKGLDSLRIRLDTGDERLYRGSLRGVKGQLEKYVGHPVTVWSQQIYEAWPPFIYEGFREMKQGNQLLLHYNEGALLKQMHPEHISWFKFYFCLAAIPLLIVGWACRKGVDG